ncbi:MAG: hypothetical protein E7Z91_04985 [Cyanobacteria bacterium SIG30]|nr:hypothetical protein [Cyanobacteria bacterium SIG30]
MAEREIFQLEDSLKEFLINELTRDAVDKFSVNLNRYKNLKLLIDPAGRFKEPNFKVQVGIFEVYLTIEEGQKLSGSIGSSDELLIMKWLDFGSNRALLRMFWLGESIDKSKGKIVPFDLE